MKTIRIINALIWAILTIVSMVFMCITWHSNGCRVIEIIVGCIAYTFFGTLFTGMIDKLLKLMED